MAIYWVDPYIGSTNGGIHGTTSTASTIGDGSYATPWRCVDIQTQGTYLGVLADGDEVRFKGLSEDTFFPPANVRTFTVSYSGPYPIRYTPNSSDNYRLVRTKDSRGQLFYLKFWNAGQLYTVYSPSYWQLNVPILDDTYGYYPFDTNYSISLSTWASNTPLFQNINKEITITSGWTSETERNGITVFDFMSSSFGNPSFGSTAEQYYYKLTWDCPELIVTCWQSQQLYVCGNSVNIKAMAPVFYQPGYAATVYSGSGNASYYRANSGNITVGTIATGGYTNLYGNGNTGSSFTIDVPYLVAGVNGQILAYSYGERPTAIVKMNKYYNFQPMSLSSNYSGQPLQFVLTENYAFESTSNPGFNIAAQFVVTETIASTIYTEPMWSSSVFLNKFGYLVGPTSNNSVLTPQSNTYYSNSTSILKVANFNSTYYKAFVKNYTIENAGETLETVSTTPGSWSITSPYGSPYKINVLLETQSFRPVQFMSPTASGHATAIVYNSANFSGALTWKMFGSTSGATYADTFTVPLPSYATSDLTFTGLFTQNTTPGITFTVTLYGYSVSSASTINLGAATLTTDGNSVTATKVLTASSLSSSNITSLYAIVAATKTSNTVSELAIHSLTVE